MKTLSQAPRRAWEWVSGLSFRVARWLIDVWAKIVGFALAVQHHILTVVFIVRNIDGIRRDFDKLAQVYGALAIQHRNVAAVAVETRRRLRHHESGPLRASRVILDKRDGEKRRKQLTAENGQAHDTNPSIPISDHIPKGD